MSSYKIIGGDGQEYGPVTTDQLQQWIAEGRINGQTLIQIEGAEEWQAAGTVPELAGLLGGAGGAIPAAAGPQPAAAEEILARDYLVQTGAWIGAGWELVKARFWLLVGATLVILLIQGAAESIPYAGSIAGIIITGPLYGGLYWLNLRLIRGEPAEFSDAFAGFNRAFAQLMLVNIVISLIIVACLVPGAAGIAGGIFLMDEVSGEVGTAVIVVGSVFALVGVVAVTYLTVCWLFAIPLVVDRQMDFWGAMKLSRAQVSKHWWGMFGYTIVVGLVVMLGILLCCIGILVTIPIAVAATMYAYEDIFGGHPATSA